MLEKYPTQIIQKENDNNKTKCIPGRRKKIQSEGNKNKSQKEETQIHKMHGEIDKTLL